jgi:hypothetical protein
VVLDLLSYSTSCTKFTARTWEETTQRAEESIRAGTGFGKKFMCVMWNCVMHSPRRVDPTSPLVLASHAVCQASERISRVREAVTRYEGYEFISVRIQDAFDRGWWERVSGGVALDLAGSLPFDLSIGGVSNVLLFRFFFQSIKFHVRLGANSCFAKSPPCLAHPNGYSVYSINPNEAVIVIHRLFDWCFSSCSGHISHVYVDIPNLFDISRRRFCRAPGNTRRVDATCCPTYA